MKTIILSSIGLLCLALASCQKNALDTDGTDIAKSVDNGYLCNTWVITDEHAGEQNETMQSVTFKDKSKPALELKKDGHYMLSYVDKASQTPVTETGSYAVDKDKKTLSLTGDMKTQALNPNMEIASYSPASTWPDYTFQMQKLSEEDLQLVNAFTSTVKTTDSRGHTTVQTKSVVETLYLEDND